MIKPFKTLNDYATELADETMNTEITEHLDKFKDMDDKQLEKFYNKLLKKFKAESDAKPNGARPPIKLRAQRYKTIKKNQKAARKKNRKK